MNAILLFVIVIIWIKWTATWTFMVNKNTILTGIEWLLIIILSSTTSKDTLQQSTERWTFPRRNRMTEFSISTKRLRDNLYNNNLRGLVVIILHSKLWWLLLKLKLKLKITSIKINQYKRRSLKRKKMSNFKQES